jgi:parallel beta-helix repeat protein
MNARYLLCIVLLTLGSGAAGAQDEARPVLRVPAQFATIQLAVDAAGPGDTIVAAGGTYCEHVIISTSGLRLRAAPGDGNPAVLSGDCFGSGYGIHVRGTSASDPVVGVEISGFDITGFDSGIVLENAIESVVHLNDVSENVYRGSATPAYGRGHGILLIASSFNDITQNRAHDNGHLGIGLFNGSNNNLVRGNRLTDNRGACSLMLWGTTNTGNRLVENTISSTFGNGIMIGPNIQTANLVAQNRVHGHPYAGIVVNPGSFGNVIQQNDARGNGLNGSSDLYDYNSTNVWQRNLGTCQPGNAGCD